MRECAAKVTTLTIIRSNDDAVVHFFFFRLVLAGDLGQRLHDVVEGASGAGVQAGSQRRHVILEEKAENFKSGNRGSQPAMDRRTNRR